MDQDIGFPVTVEDSGDRVSGSLARDVPMEARTVVKAGNGRRAAPAMLDGRVRPWPRGDESNRKTDN